MKRTSKKEINRTSKTDKVTVYAEFIIEKNVAKRVHEIFALYNLNIDDAMICMYKRTYENNDLPFRELKPAEEQEIDF